MLGGPRIEESAIQVARYIHASQQTALMPGNRDFAEVQLDNVAPLLPKTLWYDRFT
jgi:hypothetical protein